MGGCEKCGGGYESGLHFFVIDNNKASRLIHAARDLGTVHPALAEPLEKVIRSIEKTARR